VRDGVAEFFRDTALALADIVTPNRFEVEFLTGRPIPSLGEAAEAAAMLRARGPEIVLITSLDTVPGQMTMLASGPDGAWSVETPHLPTVLNGCGDVTAALFLGRLMTGSTIAEALELTAASMFAVIETTVRLDRYELALVASREELARPTGNFTAQRL
jgi:pyridoxine kinase